MMKLNTAKRAALSGLVALSVAGGSMAPVVARHAAASPAGPVCDRNPFCKPPAST